MKIQGVTLTGGIKLNTSAGPGPAPTGPSKFVVGAPYNDDPSNSGSVYVYNLDGTGELKILASDGASNDYFGNSVAISDTKVVVGAWGDDDPTDSGSVYVYNLDGTGEQKITASDAAASDLFGYSVAATDTHIVVGARGEGVGGSAYIYNLDGTGEVKITPSDAAAGDHFGWSVAMSDTKVVVGARGEGVGGSAYIYNLDGTGEVKITPSDAAAGDLFGERVAMSDTHIVVGAQGNDDSGSMSGSAYIYNLDGTGEVKITASDAAADDRFGWSVAISDTKVTVGARNQDNATGAVYVYNTDGTGELKILASDATDGSGFGFSVAATDTKIVVGASQADIIGSNSGSVYVYNTDGTGEQKIMPSDGADSDQFGRSVAIN